MPTYPKESSHLPLKSSLHSGKSPSCFHDTLLISSDLLYSQYSLRHVAFREKMRVHLFKVLKKEVLK